MLDGIPDARPFETTFALNDGHMIATQIFQAV